MKVSRCQFGINGGMMFAQCKAKATLVTNTGYKCCEAHAPRRNGKIEERCNPIRFALNPKTGILEPCKSPIKKGKPNPYYQMTDTLPGGKACSKRSEKFFKKLKSNLRKHQDSIK